MTIRALLRGSALLASVFAFACGGTAGPAAAPANGNPSATPAATPSPAPGKVVFRELSRDKQREYMLSTVLPKMRHEFQDLDAKRYAHVTCGTCHGPSAKEGNFAMPNPSLPKLDPTDGFAKHQKQTPEVLKFMEERVVPQMASLLGEPAYDPTTHQGFGCFDCHVQEGK
jgi:hypothetical protein